MSEEKLALTNEQLGRLLRAVEIMHHENRAENRFLIDKPTKEELEMYYGYVCDPDVWEGVPIQAKYKDAVFAILDMLEKLDPRPTKNEVLGIAYCVGRLACQKYFRWQFE